MKMSMTAALLTFLSVAQLAASHASLRRAAPAPASSPLGNPALGIVQGGAAGPDDYFGKAWTGENTGDRARGAGGCVGFRRTLQCNPSGVRDPTQDKSCEAVVNADESGFCECGGFAQFAAVDCEHRPFTCEVMCLKYAVVAGKQAVFRNVPLSPAQAQSTLDQVMWQNQTDLEAMKIMMDKMSASMDRAMLRTNQEANIARASMKKYLDMMKEAHDKDAAAAAAEIAHHKEIVKYGPWKLIWENGNKMIEAGKGIQSKVLDVLPFDPVQAQRQAATNGDIR